MRRKITGIVCLTILVFFQASTQATAESLTIHQAYEAIPHRQTVFDESQAEMSEEEIEYLGEFFHLVDLAMVERVGMLLWLLNDGRRGKVATEYDAILEKIEALNTPPKLKKAQRLVVEAIKEQRQFLENWNNNRGKKVNIAADPLVRSANGKLIAAYTIIMEAYPQEGLHNKAAFFDYLCALDFV